MNKHPKEVVDFMKSTSHIGRPRKSKDLASYEDKYGEERIIHLTRSGLRVKNKNTTVVFQLNQRVAELTSQKIKARRIALGLTLEDVCIRSGLVSSTPKSRMWEIENGTSKCGLRFGTLYALAVGLECSPFDLLPDIKDVLAEAKVSSVSESTLKVMI